LRVVAVDPIQIDDASFAVLRQSFRGELIRPGDPAYMSCALSGMGRSIAVRR
jgi:hypothetical protein